MAPAQPIDRSLARRILALALLPALLIAIVSVFLIEVQVSDQIYREVGGQLSIAEEVTQTLLSQRAEDLTKQAEIVSRDPKFFALLAQTGIEYDAVYRRTMQGIVEEFATTLESDFFQVVDAQGYLQASPGSALVQPIDVSSDPDIATARTGRPTRAYWILDGQIVQSVAVPIFVGRRLLGVLRHGRALEQEVADRIRRVTRCEVTLLVENRAVTSTHVGDGGSFLAAETPLHGLLGPIKAGIRLERSTTPEEQFLNHLRLRMLGTVLIVLLGSGVLAFVVTRRIIDPVDQLVEAARRLEQGEADLPVSIETRDELEYLARRFVEMRSALRRQIQALEELDRMKTVFLTVASHELRTPATIIGGAVDLIRDHPAVSEEPTVRELFDALSEGSNRLQRAVNRITDMSFLDRQQMEMNMGPIDARGLTEELEADWIQMRGNRDIRVECAYPPPGAKLWGDRTRLRQAMGNLLHNALRFTPDGGTVSLSILPSAENWLLVVEDTGAGVPVEERTRIFERFYEAGDVAKHSSGDGEFGRSGLGIGLPITRGIVQAHGGTIHCEGRAGCGSRFVVELPSPRTVGGHAYVPHRETRLERAA